MTKNCKHEIGYYRYFRTKGKGHYTYKSDGTYDDESNGSMWEGFSTFEEKTKHCRKCHKIIKKL